MSITAQALAVQRRTKRKATLISASTGLAPANISAIFTGTRIPRVDTVEKLLDALEVAPVLLPKVPNTVHEITREITVALDRNLEAKALRIFFQLNNDLATTNSFEQALAVGLTPPESTGNRQWDALIAGLVEFRFKKKRFTPPTWVNETVQGEGGFLSDAPWVGVDKGLNDLKDLYKSDPSFLRRGIFFAVADLEVS